MIPGLRKHPPTDGPRSPHAVEKHTWAFQRAVPRDARGHVVITGGAGFIGSHLCERFLREGYDVTAIDSFLTGVRQNIDDLMAWPEFHLMSGDVTRPITIARHVDLVLHCACPGSPTDFLDHSIHAMKVNSFGTLHTIDLAKAHSARYVYASTSEVYGDPLEHPQREEYWGNVNPIGSRGVCDEAKRFGEALTMAYHRVHAVDVRIARIFNTYGPHMRRSDGRAIPAFIDAALLGRPLEVFGDGGQARCFCFIDDLIEGIFRLATYPDLGGQIVNLGNDRECSLRDLARTVKRLLRSGSPVVFRPLPKDDPKKGRPDLTKARQLLGYVPRIPLEEGLLRTIAWFIANSRSSPAVGECMIHAVWI